jgi:hypothetical protein
MMLLDIIRQLLFGSNRPPPPSPAQSKADRVTIKADRVLEEFRATERVIRGKRR